MKERNGTKYPIVLVHGMGIRDRKRISSWGRVPKALTDAGYTVFQGEQDANASVADNARMLQARMEEILAECGCDKVNIIAHSKGGLDARHMISQLGMGDKVATLSTVSTPHNGSKTMDVLLKFPKPLLRFGCAVTDGVMRLAGDTHPHTYEVIHSFSTAAAAEFNRTNRDDERVVYQSYSFVMKHWYSDLLMLLPHAVVYAIEGKNDGLLTPAATRHGRYRGVYTGNGRRGISHWDEVDFRRRRLSAKCGEQVSDIALFYIAVAEELKTMGF